MSKERDRNRAWRGQNSASGMPRGTQYGGRKRRGILRGGAGESGKKGRGHSRRERIPLAELCPRAIGDTSDTGESPIGPVFIRREENQEARRETVAQLRRRPVLLLDLGAPALAAAI